MITTFLILSTLHLPSLPEDWDKVDTAMLSVLLVESLYDVGNTRYRLIHPTLGLPKGDRFEEQDPLLGSNPGSLRIWASFAIFQVAMVTACVLLPSTWCKVLEGIAVGAESFNLLNGASQPGYSIAYKVAF